MIIEATILGQDIADGARQVIESLNKTLGIVKDHNAIAVNKTTSIAAVGVGLNKVMGNLSVRIIA